MIVIWINGVIVTNVEIRYALRKNRQMMIKIIFHSIIASNIGYTVFLLPVLGGIRPDRVPLTVVNIAAFAAIDTLGGLLLGVLIHFLLRKTSMNITFASGIPLFLLWLAYWLPASQKRIDLIVIVLDGAAAAITWMTFITLHRSGQWFSKS